MRSKKVNSLRPKRDKINYESLSIINIPKHLQNFEIKDFITKTESLKKVKSYVEKYVQEIQNRFANNVGILFCGSNGVGKSTLASIILRQAYLYRFSCKRITFVDYLSMYTRIWDSRGGDKDDLLYDFLLNVKGVEFLVLEELGKEIDSKVSTPILEDLLRYREERGLVIILCTNLSPTVIKEKYGESVFSLLKGLCVPIVIEGKDFRGVKKNA